MIDDFVENNGLVPTSISPLSTIASISVLSISCPPLLLRQVFSEVSAISNEMSSYSASAPPVLLRIRNNNAEVAYILFLSLDRTDLLTSLLSAAEPPTSPTSPRSLETVFRPRNLDLSGMRVEETTIDIGGCPIASPEVRHIAYHRRKALALLNDQRWFSHPESSKRQLYAEHYYSRDSIRLIEQNVQEYRRASRQSLDARRGPVSHSVDDRETDDEGQRTAAIVAAITANNLQQIQNEDEAEGEMEVASDAETGSQTLTGSLRHERTRSGGQRSPSSTVREPWAHGLTNELAQAALQTVELERSYPSTAAGPEHRRPRRASTSAKTPPHTTRQSPVSPKPKGGFWKSLRRQPDFVAASKQSPNIPRRASTSARRSPEARDQAKPMYPEGIWESPRPAPKPPVAFKPPVPSKDDHQSSHHVMNRCESDDTMNSFAFVVKATQGSNFF